MSSNSKIPPNILIFTDNASEYKKIKYFLQNILGNNSYTIYNLTTNDFQKSAIWIPSCALLISPESFDSSQIVLGQKVDSFKKFLHSGGKILSLPALNDNVECDHRVVNNSYKILYRKEIFKFESSYQNDTLIKKEWNKCPSSIKDLFYSFETSDSKGSHFVSKALIESNDQESDKYLKDFYLNILEDYFKLHKTVSVNFSPVNIENYSIFSKNKLLQSVNVISNYLNGSMKNGSKLDLNLSEVENFNHIIYFENLKTRSVGTIFLYSDLVESTMNSITNLPSSLDNILVIARQQTQGQGNNKNEWLSPMGCCMFTLFLNLNSNTFSTSRICLLQFAAALSCVKAIKSYSGCENLPFGIKWPNDIYYDAKIKLGGVLVKSSLMGNQIGLKIGLGLNLNNEHPTVCLNSILRENNLMECSQEIFLANFMSFFESYVNLLSESSFNSLLKFTTDFQENWIHQNKKVKVNFWDEEVEIIGINEFGYLKVRRSDNTEHCLQPDGNRFDLMQNLIVLR